MSYVLSPAQKSIYCLKTRRVSRRYSAGLVYRKKIAYGLIFAIIFLFVFYIFQTNSISSDSYKLQEYQKKLSLLQDEQRSLQLKLSEVRSLSFLKHKIEELNMVQAQKIEHLSPATEMAVK